MRHYLEFVVETPDKKTTDGYLDEEAMDAVQASLDAAIADFRAALAKVGKPGIARDSPTMTHALKPKPPKPKEEPVEENE